MGYSVVCELRIVEPVENNNLVWDIIEFDNTGCSGVHKKGIVPEVHSQ